MICRDAEGPIHRVTLPWPKRELSPNARVHHFVKARAVKAYRTGCAWEAKAAGRKIGICGQAPSDYPEFARFLVECGIDSISLNPDAVLRTTLDILAIEAQSSEPPLQ